MSTRLEFVQLGRSLGFPDDVIQQKMNERRAKIGAFDDDPVEAPIAADAAASAASGIESPPVENTGSKNWLKEVVRYVAPARVKYAEEHPGGIAGEIIGAKKPSLVGEIGADLNDALSLPRRVFGGLASAMVADWPGVKEELQRTKGKGFIEDLARESPLMLIPGYQAKSAVDAGRLASKVAPAADAGGLALSEFTKSLQAAPGMVSRLASKASNLLKRGAVTAGKDIAEGVVNTLPSVAVHQAESVAETDQYAPGGAAAELIGGGAVPVPLKAIGRLASAFPAAAKFLMSHTTGGNKAALERAAQKNGVQELAGLADPSASDNLADELIDFTGNKAAAADPESKKIYEILPKLPNVRSVEPVTNKNSRAFGPDGKEYGIDMSGRVDPGPRPDNLPTLQELEADAAGRLGESGLPSGSEPYEATAKEWKRAAAERADQARVLDQSVRKAIQTVGPIYVDDSMRAQLGLSGARWKEAAKEYGLNMFTSDKKVGKSLDVAALEIGELQGQGMFEGLEKINGESDLVDALYNQLGKKEKRPDDLARFLDNAIRTGENLGEKETVLASALEKNDLFRVGGELFKVTKKADGEIILDGHAKLILGEKAQVHFDAGSRINGKPDAFPKVELEGSLGMPEAGKIHFVKELEKGREGFRDLLEQKLGETTLTPEAAAVKKKLTHLMDLADEQLDGRETLTAVEANKFKQAYQSAIAEQYKSRESDEYFETYKKLATALRRGLEQAAEASKNPEYIKLMRSLSAKMDAVDRVETRFVGGNLNRAREKAARQIGIINNVPQREALKELETVDHLFGTNFATRAKDISWAKMLQMGEHGVPLAPIHTTGKALLGVSAGSQLYTAKDGGVNPFAVVGLLLSSPRMAIYAFRGLNAASRNGAALRGTARPVVDRIVNTAVTDRNEKKAGDK